MVVPRRIFDDALRAQALAAGATPVRARVTAVDRVPGGPVRALITSDGGRLAGDIVIGADGALSQVAQLAGMLDPSAALWGFAIRGYIPAEVPLPLLVLLDERPWHIYPGYGWLFPGADGQANVGIGIGMGRRRAPAPLRPISTGCAPCSGATAISARTRTRDPSWAAGSGWAGPAPRPRQATCC